MEAPIRRKLAGLAGLLVILAACSSGHGPHNLQEAVRQRDEGTVAVANWTARASARTGSALCRTARLRLPGPGSSDCCTTKSVSSIAELSEPFPMLDRTTSLKRADYAWVRARQRYLKGQHHLVQGDLPRGSCHASKTLCGWRRRHRVPDVFIDANILKGVALLRLGRSAEGDATLTAAVAAARAAGDRFREAQRDTESSVTGYLLRDRYDAALPFFEARDVHDRSVVVHGLCDRIEERWCLLRASRRFRPCDRRPAHEASRSTNNAVRVSTLHRHSVLSARRYGLNGSYAGRRFRTCVARSKSRLGRIASKTPRDGPTISRPRMPHWVTGTRPSA